MKIAIPISNERLCLHFGHCDMFAVIDVDDKTLEILDRKDHTPPPHEPGVLPAWLADMKVDVIIAGGMGQRAQQLFVQNNIKVIIGATLCSPEELVRAYLNKTLKTGDNICDH